MSICVASIVRFLLFSGEPHPLKKGKGLLVDHQLAVLALPLIISGVAFGVLLNIVTPPVFIVASFVVV